jgi:signal transduction histidine kinase
MNIFAFWPCKLITKSISKLKPLLMLWGLWMLCAGMPTSHAVSLEKVTVTITDKQVPLGIHSYYLSDPHQDLSLSQVRSDEFASRWTKSIEEQANFGFSQHAYWFAVALELPATDHDRWQLVIDNPILELVEVYEIVAGQAVTHVISGDAKVFSKRPIQHRHFIFPLHSKAQDTRQVRLFIHVESRAPLTVPLTLWQQRAFNAHDQYNLLGLGIYYGVMMLIIIYNFFLFIAIRDKSYLYFVLLVAFNMALQGVLDGINYQYFSSNSPWWNGQTLMLSLPLSLLFTWLFTHEFLDIKKHYPALTRYIYGAVVVCVLLFFMGWFNTHKITAYLLGAACLITYVSAFIMGLYVNQKGKKEAALFNLAWAFYFVGAGIFIAKTFGLLPSTVITENAAPLAFIILVIMLSIALAHRFNFERKAKELALQFTESAQQKTLLAQQGRTAAQEKATSLTLLDKQKTAFFQNISHELRTPLTLILNPLEEELRLQPNNKNIQVALNNSRRLLRLVNQVLDFQKLSAGAMKVEITALNLIKFMRISGDYFSSSSASRHINFSLSLDGTPLTKDTPAVYLMANLDGLEKVVFNFLSNALKFTPIGGNIELGIQRKNALTRIFVKDSGSGILRENQEDLFKSFNQIDGDNTLEHEDTGLGLTLAKQLTQQMKGKIGLDSEWGQGSTFWCEFSARHFH